MAVNFPNSPANGDTFTSGGISFTYNSTDGTWASSTSASGINDLSDVDTSTNAPTTGQLLQWNGTNWVPYTQIVEVDQWRLSSQLDTDANPITTGFERVDNASFAKIGTGMSVSSGVWTFPQTGVYEINVNFSLYIADADTFVAIQTYATINGGTDWDRVAQAGTSAYTTTGFGNPTAHATSRCFINVTNTSNVQAKFDLTSMFASWSTNYVRGNTDFNQTSFSFIRVGDSQ